MGGRTASTPSRDWAVASGTSLVNLRAASPFQTVYLQVIDDPLDGYWKLQLAAQTSDITIALKFGSTIPENLFQTVFSVALIFWAVPVPPQHAPALSFVDGPLMRENSLRLIRTVVPLGLQKSSCSLFT